jgi:hypothetical protein
MANYWDRLLTNAQIIGPIAYLTVNSYALDSNFVLDGGGGSGAGKCLGCKINSPVTDTITDILFYLSAAPASAHNLSVNVCVQTSSSLPGAAVANGTVTISGGTTAGKWIKATFSSKPSLTAGVAYWIVIGDPSGAASNYSIVNKGGLGYSSANFPYGTCYTSSDGFKTNGSAVGNPPPVCVSFTGGTYLGQPYTLASTADSSADLERGWKIAVQEDIIVTGISASAFDSGGSIKIYQDGQNPGGTIFSGFNGGSAFAIDVSAVANTALRIPATTLLGGTTYRIVQDPNGVAVTPGYITIEDDTTHAAILEACGFPGAFNMQHTEEAAGPTWVDTPSKIPRMSLIIQSNPAIDTPTVANVLTADTVRGANGTFDEAARNTDPGEANVKSATSYKIQNVEKSGSYAAAGGMIINPGLSGGLR